MNRLSALWAMVVFFAASLVFIGLHRLTADEGPAVTYAAQAGALVVVLGVVVLVVQRLR